MVASLCNILKFVGIPFIFKKQKVESLNNLYIDIRHLVLVNFEEIFEEIHCHTSGRHIREIQEL